MATPTELARIAALANALRPDWPVRSVLTYLERDHATKAYRDLAVAMAHIATDPQTQTPRRLSEAGPWWHTTTDPTATAVPGPHDARCTVYGHEHYRLPCKGCRADELAARAPSDVDVLARITPAQAARNSSGAASVLAALSTARRDLDPRERAAGMGREDD